MPEVLPPTLMVPDSGSTSSSDSPKSTKSKKLIKFSPHLRKKSRSKDNAVKDMDSGGAARDHGDRLPNGLNDKEKQDLQQVFEMFDKNKDGKISCEELGVVLRTLGHRYSQTEVEEMIKTADKNDNGFVEYDEFLLMMKKWSASPAQQAQDADDNEKALEAFRIFDMDGNGYIDRHELRFIMSKLGESPCEEDICEMFRLADLNGDGLIDYEEFTMLMANLNPGPSQPASSSATPTSSKASSSSKGVKKK
ncbi:neo-calmodulin-like isoform X2 [Pomacea canaliculata]|uniref:neo-calmodulin-like isoform X2 n=1 Tax=Pomacea canaliculata TaxID=400727 RepID=UPI000D73AC19|nr:neo-calmodulin-like isoform X2 [Pomacea canaliculata]